MEAAILEIPKKHVGRGGEGSIRQLGPARWQISYYDAQGRRRRESFRTLGKAEKKLKKQTVLREAGKLDPHEAQTKVDALADAYLLYARNSRPKSAKWIEGVWRKNLEPFFGGRVASRISTDLFQEYIAHRREDLPENDAALLSRNSTINRELAILKAMFYLGSESEPPKVLRVPKFPAKLQEPNPRQGFISDAEYAKLQEHCKEPGLAALIACAYSFGFRKGEVLRMNVSQIDLNSRTISLPTGTTKSGQGRVIAMTQEVHDRLKTCTVGKSSTDAVFTWGDGSPIEDFRGSWAAITKAAGLPGILFHNLRRSAVMHLTEAGVDRDVCKAISGHRTDAVFLRYNIVSTDRLADAMSKLEQYRNGTKWTRHRKEKADHR